LELTKLQVKMFWITELPLIATVQLKERLGRQEEENSLELYTLDFQCIIRLDHSLCFCQAPEYTRLVTCN